MIGAMKAAPTGVAPWVPTNVSGLEFWYKPQDTGNLTGTTPVLVVADSSGNTQPLTRTNGSLDSGGSINGHNALTPSSPDYHTVSVPGNPTVCTMFAVVKRVNNNNTVSSIFGSISAGSAGGMLFRTDNGAPRLVKSQIAAIGSTSSTTIANGSAALIIATFADASHGDSYAFRVNGSAAGSGSHGVTLLGSTTAAVGADYSGIGVPTDYLDFLLGECGRYNSILSGGDIALLESYAMGYWGL